MKKLLFLSFAFLYSQSIYTQQVNTLKDPKVIAVEQALIPLFFDRVIKKIEETPAPEVKTMFLHAFEGDFKKNTNLNIDLVKYAQLKLIINLVPFETFKLISINFIKNFEPFFIKLSENDNDIISEKVKEEMKEELTKNFIEAAKIDKELYAFLQENKKFTQQIACAPFENFENKELKEIQKSVPGKAKNDLIGAAALLGILFLISI